MKIKGWEKLSGITYKGLCIVNPIHNADETSYETDIINLNKSHKPKWKLKVLTDNHKFRMGSTDFFVTIEGEDKMSSQTIVSRAMMLKLSSFRGVFENLVDEILMMEDKNNTANIIPNNVGIVNTIVNSGTTIDYGKMMQEMLNSIKESDEALTTLKDYINKI